jgi:hypothetical protein
MDDFKNCLTAWKDLIAINISNDDSKQAYLHLLEERAARLRLS